MAPRKQVTYSSRPNHAARAAHRAGERQFRTYDTSHIRPRKSKAPLIVAAVLAVVVIGGLSWSAVTLFKGCSGSGVAVLAEGESASVTIPEGSGAQAIAALLVENRVIGNAEEFTAAVTQGGQDAALKPGAYVFTGPLALDQVISALVAGPGGAGGATLTIPEGLTLANTALKVAEATAGAVSAEDFTAAASNASAYEQEFPFVAGAYNNSLEGFLFPKTYPLPAHSTADSLIRQMLAQYQTETAGLDYTFAQDRGLSATDVLILASIIEKEADNDTRANVSSVFYNRFAQDMPLQSDATTAYTIKGDPKPEDLQVDGPYNTYLNKGLPAGPICSPGLASLQAALAPADTPYLYFYFVKKADGSGMDYYFSETYDQHKEAIAGS